MNKVELANELVRIAKSMTGATKDLAEIKAILPAMQKKQQEYADMQEQMRRELAVKWHEATQELNTKTIELTAAITKELVAYFNKSGKGVRSAEDMGSLVEVFIGSEDGVKRYQSKVSVHIALTFKQQEKAVFMLRNENLDDITGDLADKGTIDKLMRQVEKADKKGFWKSPEVE